MRLAVIATAPLDGQVIKSVPSLLQRPTMTPVDTRELPLLLASERFASSDETEPLDRLRMQKGVFLLEKNGPDGWHDLFPFRPYDWGPYSRELAATVGGLVAADLLDKVEHPNRRYSSYRTSRRGEDEVVAGSMSGLTGPQQEFVRKVRRFVTTRSFTRLLRDVYEAYPEYAVASRFSG